MEETTTVLTEETTTEFDLSSLGDLDLSSMSFSDIADVICNVYRYIVDLLKGFIKPLLKDALDSIAG